MNRKTLIIGGVAGGATTAARLRRKDAAREIIIFERGAYISYANCGLPYYIGDVIKSRDALLLQTPKQMKSRYNIEVRVQNEVTKIFPDAKKIQVKNLKTDEIYEESYDELVIATGSSPLRPPIPGIDGEGIYTLWTIPDTDRIKDIVDHKKPKHAAVIGGGFIGLEMAENLVEAGIKVTIIEMQDQVMAPLDMEMANLLHENILANGVDLILQDGVKEFKHEDGSIKIKLSSQTEVVTDMVILSIGVKPNSTLTKEAGLQLNQRGGIVVNEFLETSHPDIYAVGDVIEVENFITKDKTMIPLAGPANKQARILADTLSGDRKAYNGTMGTAVAKVFDLQAASTGLNEKQLVAMGKVKNKDYFSILINQKSHAGYYPGAAPLTLKLLFNKEGRIFGAQVVGQDGADKRIDTIAVTMRLNGTIYDLEELELAYAPPFSSAKDPVNMLGFVAENVLNGLVSFSEWDEVDAILADEKRKDSVMVLDVREEVEVMVSAIEGSVPIPLGDLKERLNELDKTKHIIVVCAVGVRAYNGARILMQNGFEKVSVLSGGMSFYKSMHYDRKNVELIKGGDETMSLEKSLDATSQKELKVLDCCGLQCPGPIVKVNEAVSEMKEGEVLKVSATDMGFASDIGSWCRTTGNTLVKSERINKENVVYIKKGTDTCEVPGTFQKGQDVVLPQGKTMIVFSGDLDKALASFIIANGATAMGRPVTMFFTFWGLNILRKGQSVPVKKTIIEKMFGFMMPRGPKKLKISKMNMAGMGTAMMKKVMQDKNVNSLEELMQLAMRSGVKIVACTMSMDVMGLKKEELIDGIEYAGVASYLGDAENANVNLFI